MNQRKSFRVILAENNALQRLYDFEQVHPDINIHGSKFSYQEQDENGHYLTDTSVRISFDAMFCRSINEVFVAAETYVWLRDKLNERGMYGCLPGKVHYKDSQANGEFTYGIHAYEKSIRISWREHDKQEWKYKTCKTKEDVIDFIDKFEKEFTEKLVSKIKSHRLYNQFKVADNRNITREDASNKLELKFEKDGYKFRVRMWVDENNQLTATISGLYKADTMCKSFQQDLFFNRNYYVGEDAVTGITREMIKVAYQFMKDEV